jgi:hypothetical protein
VNRRKLLLTTERTAILTAFGAVAGARAQTPIDSRTILRQFHRRQPTGRNGGADRRREQHRHPLGLALVPHRDQVVGVLKDLPLGRTARSDFLLGLLPTGILHFEFVESHGRIVAEALGQNRQIHGVRAMSAMPPIANL